MIAKKKAKEKWHKFYAIVPAFETAPSWPDFRGTKSLVVHWFWRKSDSEWMTSKPELILKSW
jgi:hypothetical protein